MSIQYLTYKAYEESLVEAFNASEFRPEVEAISHSDMITTGGTVYGSQFKISFTTKTGAYKKFSVYIPESGAAAQVPLSLSEQTVMNKWLNSVYLENNSLGKNLVKKAANNKV